MGELCSKDLTSKKKHYSDTKTVINHPIIGDLIEVYEEMSEKHFYQREIDITKYISENKEQVSKRINLQNPCLIGVQGFIDINETNKLAIYESYECTLRKEIFDRIQQNKPFSEKQIYALLVNTLTALAYLQHNQFTHGRVCLDTIVKSQDNQYKVIDPFVFESFQTNFSVACNDQYSEASSYLSPELKNIIQKKEFGTLTQKTIKEDIFALGVLILRAMSLNPEPKVSIGDMYAYAQQKYSSQMMLLVNKMTDNLHGLRIDAISALRVLNDLYLSSRSSHYQSSSIRTSYKNDESGSPRLTTGISLNEIKRNAVSFQFRGVDDLTKFFSPKKNNAAEQELKEGSFAQVSQQIAEIEESPKSEKQQYHEDAIEEQQQTPQKQNIDHQEEIQEMLTPQPKNLNLDTTLGSGIRQTPSTRMGTDNRTIDHERSPYIDSERTNQSVSPKKSKFTDTDYQTPEKGSLKIQNLDSASSPSKYKSKYLKQRTSDSTQFLQQTQNFINERITSSSSPTKSPIDKGIEVVPANPITSNRHYEKYQVNDVIQQGYLNQAAQDDNKFPENPDLRGMYSTDPYTGKLLNNVTRIAEQYNDGSIYQGEFQGHLRHGKGKLTYKDGTVYDGDWVLGRMQGYGELYYASGILAYEGQWKNNKYEGYGILYNENPIPQAQKGQNSQEQFSLQNHVWERYDGEFLNDKWNGIGSLYFSNGDKFYGEFQNDLIEGEGTYYRKDGQSLTGTWHSNCLIKML